MNWGGLRLCDTRELTKWLNVAASGCNSCIDGEETCAQPPRILYHTFIDSLHPEFWQADLLGIQAYLLTQNLLTTNLIVWVSSIDVLVTSNTTMFFKQFKTEVLVRVFDYSEQIVGTPFENDPFFGDFDKLASSFNTVRPISDLARLLILHNFGGMWIDNNVLLLRCASLRPCVLHAACCSKC